MHSSLTWFHETNMASLTELYSDNFTNNNNNSSINGGDMSPISGSGDRILDMTQLSQLQQQQQQQQSPVPRLPLSDIKLTFAQFHGKPINEEAQDGEIITTVEFNDAGDFFAVGDRGGRVTVYRKDTDRPHKMANFKSYIQFQSHEPEFDYLKSIEIEEKIVQVKWVPRDTNAKFLLSSNDKTVKLWRIGEKSLCLSNENLSSIGNNNSHNANNNLAVSKLVLPKSTPTIVEPCATVRKSFSNAHSYHINTISVNSDQETFISSDDLRINLWNLEVTNQSFMIVDVKPEAMESLQEVITTCTFHPTKCHLFTYSTSKGVTKLCDMRASALCDRHSKLFHEDFQPRGYYSEIVHSVCDAQFSHSGRYLATRDYMNLKIWDVLMENKPLHVIPIHGFLNNHLNALYDNDSIFDKFCVSWSSNDTKIVTGSYDSLFNITERSPCKSSTFEIPKECYFAGLGNVKIPLMKPKKVVDSISGPNNNANNNTNTTGKGKAKEQEIHINSIDFSKKMIACQWSPTENVMALANNNNLFIFQEKKGVYS